MKWISVKDSLPNKDGVYLAWLERPLKHNTNIVFYTYYFNEWLSINGSTWPDKPKPTHWMLLPDSPESEL